MVCGLEWWLGWGGVRGYLYVASVFRYKFGFFISVFVGFGSVFILSLEDKIGIDVGDNDFELLRRGLIMFGFL